jgi:hypothetical protein
VELVFVDDRRGGGGGNGDGGSLHSGSRRLGVGSCWRLRPPPVWRHHRRRSFAGRRRVLPDRPPGRGRLRERPGHLPDRPEHRSARTRRAETWTPSRNCCAR